MLSGFNTNLRHRGVLFHVQTEDSGLANPHIISHLFHGGNILVSRKSDYRSMLATENLQAAVRETMEAQHKAMLRSLITGECDGQIIARLGPDVFGESGVETDPCIEAVELGVEADAQLEAEVEAEVVAIDADPVDSTIAATPPVAETSEERIARVFGDSVVSQKPLDEVVLDYLVESARKRKRPSS